MDTDPELLTLGAAARACNRSKATISRAVRSGRLPAKAAEDNAGGWLIRREDLDRVFPPLAERNGSDTVSDRDLRAELERLRKRLLVLQEHAAETAIMQAETEMLRERLAEKNDVIGDLRRRLDAETEERRRLTALLTDQRPARRRWWPFGR